MRSHVSVGHERRERVECRALVVSHDRRAIVSARARPGGVLIAIGAHRQCHPGPLLEALLQNGPGDLLTSVLGARRKRQLPHDEYRGLAKLLFLIRDAPAQALFGLRVLRVVILEVPAQDPVGDEERLQLDPVVGSVLVDVRHTPPTRRDRAAVRRRRG